MSLTREKIKDAGLALILILLILALKFDLPQLVAAAAIGILLCLLVPKIFYPFAWLWFGLSHVLSHITSKIVLTLIYVAVVIPVGGFRKIAGADPMARNQWKQSQTSVFIDRNHTFGREDIEHPY